MPSFSKKLLRKKVFTYYDFYFTERTISCENKRNEDCRTEKVGRTVRTVFQKIDNDLELYSQTNKSLSAY